MSEDNIYVAKVFWDRQILLENISREFVGKVSVVAVVRIVVMLAHDTGQTGRARTHGEVE